MVRLHISWISALALIGCSACVLAPVELKDERLRLDRANASYTTEPAERTLPPLATPPTFDDLLHRALLSSGELEAAWHDWRTAVAEVTAASAWPNTNVELDFEHVLAGESGSAWERTTVGLGFDPAETLELPAKTELRGRVAFQAARAAAERFRATRFAVQREFKEAFVAWVRADAEVRSAERSLALVRTATAAAERARAAGPNALGIVRARIENAASENELERTRAEVLRTRAEVMARARVPDEGLATFELSWPTASAPSMDDAGWIELAARSNPLLLELAAEVAGRSDALALARAAWWPDLAPFAGFSGGATRFIGATLSIPTQTQKLRANVEASRGRLAGVEALARQETVSLSAAIVADLIALREAERALDFSTRILQPLAHELSNSARAAYAGGTATQLEWLDALRAENEARTAEIGARAARETSLARLEEWVAVDLATITTETEVEGE